MRHDIVRNPFLEYDLVLEYYSEYQEWIMYPNFYVFECIRSSYTTLVWLVES
jgi:hypothetical protein